MFSSNQELHISGSIFNMTDLEKVINFVLDSTGGTKPQSYQVSGKNEFAVGWHNNVPGWTSLSNDENGIPRKELIQLIYNYLRCLPSSAYKWEFEEADGHSERGFLLDVIGESAKSIEGINNPFYCIFKISPFVCFYGK